MYTKFYDNTIITKFIKELVAKTNVPFISTWKPGGFAIKGMFYLTKDAIWKCQHTGYPENINDICEENDYHTPDEPRSEENLRYFTRVCPYVFGKEYYNITGRYESKILGYDATTHFYLGQYLRMMRDVYDLDLMPFYNCFGNEYISDVDFNSNGEVFSSSNKNNLYKILSVPVKFGQTYMIAINSEVPIECICAIYGPKGYIKDLTENLNDVKDNDEDKHNTYIKYQRTQFKNPVLYKTVSWHQLYYSKDLDDNEVINDKSYDQGLGQYEKYLRLLIKIPKTSKSSIVVIEGDYPVINTFTSRNTNSVTWSNQYLYDTTVNSKTVKGDWIRPETIQGNSYSYKEPLLSPLGLLQLSDGNIYAFSDRLIEYLLQHAINHLDTFTKDIERIQTYSKSEINYLKNNSRYTGSIVPGVWDIDFQEYLFNLVKKSKNLDKKIDLNGFVDKDTESIITRGQKL